ncbi:MAG: sugar phosphate isomerase/epimerase [Clostridia bacterium]|nr:sugar phosphate isomerase/epimerase [Clostridia bacterium]
MEQKNVRARPRDNCEILCINTCADYGVDVPEQISLFREAGFSGFFTGWDGKCAEYRELAERHGMLYQSVHAPFLSIGRIWGGDGAEEELLEQLRCINGAADAGVDLVICHVYIGFEREPVITREGLDRFRRIADRAGERGIRVAFENTEGDTALSAVMDELRDYPNAGFCWDVGHEMCYNCGVDQIALYGDRLIATHINDNLGVTRPEGGITWLDDLHLLPYDGVVDWDSVAARLSACGYDGPLTFELKKHNRPNRHDCDKYLRVTNEEFLAEAFARARRLSTTVRRNKK